HERINDRFDSFGAALNAPCGMGVLIEAKRGSAFDEDHLRKLAVGIGAGEDGKILADGPNVAMLSGVISELIKVAAVVLVVVLPGNAGFGHRTEDGFLGVL